MHAVSKVPALASPGILFLKNGWQKSLSFTYVPSFVSSPHKPQSKIFQASTLVLKT